ncbi:indole-3-glycerol phosphate synthase TrpC [Blattabacterium sp. (Cryptocercus kyebangensis)]|uniref:indole-3-glycerol phosphate synthase TrpC n=1 Tax=Blattabacterium sp. (Cryptocercus kyebangensis) TaxID=298656 RepID=UPI000D7C9657|nr:indole-3-glycerol phosphate synthase TrpC [Blattabacterium sp. (Cryptocercus kyebangensis)]AWU43818.1 indole-3-glycerol phosphate synthase TrpC [Blattabacterium sp. (Cryptocercus kyebangensis)]
MKILDKIISIKQKEVYRNKIFNPIKKLEKSIFFNRKGISLAKNISKKNTFGIISEFKRKSPSIGRINNSLSVEKIVKDYEEAGVSGISILTDSYFFSGKPKDLTKTRSIVTSPLLRKDFIIDEYQIIESKSMGADVILLIAGILSKKEINNFSILSKKIGLEVIVEIHNENEMDKLTDNLDIIGINNRNLRSFVVDTNNCLKLVSKIPNNYLKIAESGIKHVKDILYLRKKGFSGFLIGENFMNTKDPGNTCKNMINELKIYE